MQRRSVPRTIPRNSLGFTLMETLVALSVIGAAVTVFISMYGSSVDLGRLARDRSLAATAAQDQLDLILRQPGAFLWSIPESGGEESFPILATAEDPKAGVELAPPAALPADLQANERTKAAYAPFRWRAFGRLPKDKEYCEVTVVVTWKQAGKEQMLALTSALPRAAMGGSK